jgi:hypothetical protein
VLEKRKGSKESSFIPPVAATKNGKIAREREKKGNQEVIQRTKRRERREEREALHYSTAIN